MAGKNDATDAMKDATGKASAAASEGMARASEQMRDAGERMQAATGAMTDTGSKLGMKVLEQAEMNTSEAFKAMRAAAQANDLAEVMRVQSEYLRDQGSRSVTQAREIGEMIAEFGRMTIGQMTGRR
ncbi:phasin family protein [Sphingomonas japonica]|uniref:Phasin domain-containing protein n=1 Tax=Sphingomonas japonica TaxID=511662 RepID=A0ABX0U256_9SPHN|nr:phasin family protein [Sphingomonas japonica]NIJ22847.1 hypothetical protein [Sphingomonas japonica]